MLTACLVAPAKAVPRGQPLAVRTTQGGARNETVQSPPNSRISLTVLSSHSSFMSSIATRAPACTKAAVMARPAGPKSPWPGSPVKDPGLPWIEVDFLRRPKPMRSGRPGWERRDANCAWPALPTTARSPCGCGCRIVWRKVLRRPGKSAHATPEQARMLLGFTGRSYRDGEIRPEGVPAKRGYGREPAGNVNVTIFYMYLILRFC